MKLKEILLTMTILFLVLYCEKETGGREELKDFSEQSLIAPPRWAAQGVIYQVFPRVYTEEGNFKALQNRLDYIKSLDVDIIWLMPIYPIGEKGRKGTLGSPFSIRDFRKVNPDYGTAEDFRSLVNAIHEKGMKVIIGMVPNHSSNDNVLMKVHPDWFVKDENGAFTREVADWSDVTDFNYDNPGMRQYMTETLLYWIREFDIDGYRCDVAGMVPFSYWEEALPKLRAEKPDIYLLAEWEDPEILIAGFNSDYGWTEYHTMKEIRHGKKRTAEIINVVEEKQNRYPQNALPMRFLENHDEQRSMKEFGPEGIEAYARLLFALPGIPLMYAGQEIGETEKPSLFEKSELDWAEADTSLLDMYCSLIRLRKRYDCFTRGEYTALQTAFMKGTAAAFLRETENSVALVVSNLQAGVAEKVIVNMEDDIRNRFMNETFMNYQDESDRISFDRIYFDAIPAFTTLVYILEK